MILCIHQNSNSCRLYCCHMLIIFHKTVHKVRQPLFCYFLSNPCEFDWLKLMILIKNVACCLIVDATKSLTARYIVASHTIKFGPCNLYHLLLNHFITFTSLYYYKLQVTNFKSAIFCLRMQKT